MVANTVGKALVKSATRAFTSNGSRLASKITTTKLAPLFTPKGAVSANIAQIETHFGKGTITATSYFDKDGKLLQQEIVKKLPTGNIEEKVRSYKGTHDTVMHTQASTKINGVETQKTYSSHHIYNSGEQKMMSREKITMDMASDGSRSETQVFENLSPNNRTYLQTNATRTSDGQLVNKTIKTNSTNPACLEDLTKSPYLYIKSYPKDEFIRAIEPYAKELQQVTDRNVKIILDEETKRAILGVSYGAQRIIKIFKLEKQNKNNLVDTLNHELRHQYQRQLVERLPGETKLPFLKSAKEMITGTKSENAFTRFLKRIGIIKEKPVTRPTPLTAEEKELAKKFKEAENNYCQPEVDKDKYFNNLLEVDARKAGAEAASDFSTLELQLSAILNGKFNRLNWDSTQFALLKSLENTPTIRRGIKFKQ
ncbi:MAG: hypothetical protein NC191_04315 [Muribaculaceae bacterium]|nr:hypothetical protein [Muribaculaceae bacterium]